MEPENDDTPAGAARAQRPGGRTARTRHAVLAAARELLVQEGAAGMRIEAIAARSGVHRSSIYRRWGTPAGIMADLAQEISAGDAIPQTGSLESDLRVVAQRLAIQLSGDGPALVRALLGWQDPDVKACLASFWRDRRADVAHVLAEHGSDADPATVTRLLAGPIHYQAVIEGTVPDDVTVSAAVTAAVREARSQHPRPACA